MPRDICIIDASPHDYTDLLEQIEAAGHVFHFATTAEDALRIRVGPDALWLVNFQLPDAPGIELSAQLRERGARSIFIVNDQQQMAQELTARVAGVPFYAVKPPQAEWVSST